MASERERLLVLLERLRQLELRLGQAHDRPILEIGRTALCEEISQLSHRLHDLRYWQGDDGVGRLAC